MDKEINNNGFEYVDLVLPSGTLWAIMNAGASKPSDGGLYFQWGDTKGYDSDQVGKEDGKKKFSKDWDDYKYGTKSNFTKYVDNSTTLELEDDAANVHMGGDWHTPTPKQIQELIDNTTITWTTQDGVNGMLFTSTKDTSKSIFIPAVGDAVGGLVRSRGDFGYVWSSMLFTGNVSYGQFLYFYLGGAGLGYNDRYCGFSVRGVIG